MPSYFIRCASFTAILLAVQLTGRSQGVVAPRAVPVTPGFGTPTGYPPSERMQVIDPDKKLSAGDQVTLVIEEDKEGGLPRVVTATGDIEIPQLFRVRVSGKTTTEASADIKRRLEADYYYHATVRLNIDRVSPISVRAGTVTISGQVRAPGPQEMIAGEDLTLSVAIQKSGNFTEWAKPDKVKLTRQVNGVAQTSIYNVEKIIRDGDSSADPKLKDGDRVFVDKAWARWK
ncbi:MAG: polysaccharide biosynthesis/export family protein [Chthoniobacter sp.]|nr:polysaccharide biosynthesis/export family protein [Chthoniobacter sp.]